MRGFNLHEYMDTYRELEDSLASTVKISHREVSKLIVKDLIAKRNNCAGKQQKAIDTVLNWYIDDEEFERFVIKGEKVK